MPLERRVGRTTRELGQAQVGEKVYPWGKPEVRETHPTSEELAVYMLAGDEPPTDESLTEYLKAKITPTPMARGRLGDNEMVRRIVEQALDPQDTMQVNITKEGEVKADMFKPEKPKGEGKAETGQPTRAKNIGYGPAMAAMTAPTGEPVSAAELRGLTPEQISMVMTGERRAEQLAQGRIGQLMDLPYKQALTERAMRPEMTPEQRMWIAAMNRQLNPLQQRQFKKLGIEMALRGAASKESIDFLKTLSPTVVTSMNLPSQVLDLVYPEEKKLEERMYQDDGGEYWWGLFEPGATTPTREKLRKATKKDLEFKEIEVSPLAREKFEELKEMKAAEARKWIADNPKLSENKEYIHQANRNSRDTTLYIWEDPGLIWGGGARKLKLPKGFMAGHFEPSMTEKLQTGETIGPYRHPKTGERVILKIVDGEVKIVE